MVWQHYYKLQKWSGAQLIWSDVVFECLSTLIETDPFLVMFGSSGGGVAALTARKTQLQITYDYIL